MAGFQRAQDIGSFKYIWLWRVSALITVPANVCAVIIPANQVGGVAESSGVSSPGEMLILGIILALSVTTALAIAWLHLVLFFAPGKAGSNQYGDDPRQRTAA